MIFLFYRHDEIIRELELPDMAVDDMQTQRTLCAIEACCDLEEIEVAVQNGKTA